MLESIIFISAICVVYPYCIYPLMLYVFSRLPQIAYEPDVAPVHYTPMVSVLLSVYNEQVVIQEKINNVLDSLYPAMLLELIVVSDGSTDATDQLLAEAATDRVKIIIQGRKGKSEALNKAVESSNGDILVFTDANTFFKPDTITRLVERFADPCVGLATGRVIPRGADTGEGLFGRFENFLKESESHFGIIAGADGALYGLRRSLFQRLMPGVINDFYHPIAVQLAGFRSVVVPDAIAYEDSSDDLHREVSRQRRMVNQALGIFRTIGQLLLSKGKLLLAWILVSHKLFRWLHVIFMAIFTIGSVALGFATNTILPLIPAISYLICFLWGYVMTKRGMVLPRLIDLGYRFQVVHFAYGLGILDHLRGRSAVTWNPRGGA